MHGPLALAHNGNIVNTASLREELLSRGFGLTASSDSEVMTLMLAAAGGQSWEDRIERTLPAWKGAFSLVLLCGDRVLAVRDPWGFRPLSVGRLPHGGYAVASETCALATLGCSDISEVAPGEIVTLQGTELHRRQALTPARRGARCTFEFVYFSRPDSVWDGRNMHHVREALGVELARESGVGRRRGDPRPRLLDPRGDRLRTRERRAVQRRADQEPLHRAHVHRADPGDPPIAASPSSTTRLPENLGGRRVVMIDDSLVRGTTAGPLVKLVRDAGATEVHVRITCPPIIHPCHFGVDMGHDGDLMSARLTVDETRERIGADSLAFLSLEGMMRAIGYDDVAIGRLLQRLLHRRLPRSPSPTPTPNSPSRASSRDRSGRPPVHLPFWAVLGPDSQPSAAQIAVHDARPRHRSAAAGSKRSPGRVADTATRRRSFQSFQPSESEQPDLVIPGPEAALVAGVADECARRGIPCFGPTRRAGATRVVEGLRPRAGDEPRHPRPGLRPLPERRPRRSDRVVPSTPVTRSSSSSTAWRPARA